MPTDTIARTIAARIPAQPPTAGWATVAALAEAISGAAVSTDGTRIYVSHGSSAGNPLAGNNTVTPGVGRTAGTAASVSRAYVAGVFCNGKHYAIGGANGAASASGIVEVYTPSGTNGAGGSWATATNMGNSSVAGSAAAVGTFIYMAGGSTVANNYAPVAANASAVVKRYDTTNGTTGSWVALPNMPAARYGGVLVAIGTKLYYLGGYDSSGTGTSTVYAYDTANGVGGTWSTLTALTNAFAAQPATVVGSLIYLVGVGGNVTAVTIYDPSTGQSSAGPALSSGHGSWSSLATLGSSVYLIAGSATANVDALDTGAAADTVSSGWSTLATPGSSRYGAATSTDGTRVFHTHGNAGGVANDGYTVSPAGTLAAIPQSGGTARQGVAGAFCNGKHYAIGGLSAAPAVVAVAEAYTPAGANGNTGTWTALTAAPVAVSYAAAAAVGNSVYVAGGQSSTSTKSQTTTFQRYDTVAGTWANLTTTAPLPAARSMGAFVAVGTKLYYIGGQDSTNTTIGSVFCFDTTTSTWSTLTAAPLSIGAYPAASVDSLIYVLGSTDVVTQPLLIFNTVTGTWSQVAAAPPNTHSINGGAAAINGTVFFVSGNNTASIDTIVAGTAGTTPFGRRIKLLQQYLAGQDVAAFSIAKRLPLTPPAAAAWRTLGSLPSSRYGAAASTDGTNIIVTHGYTSAVQNSGVTITPGGVVTALSASSSGQARQLAAATWCNGRHWVIGGLNSGNSIVGTVDAYTPGGSNGASGTWQSFTAVNPRYRAAAAAIANFIYVAGGQVNTNYNSARTDLFRYNTTNDTWTDLTGTSPMPANRTEGTMVAWNGKLYYIGGRDTNGNSVSTIFVFDPNTATWSTLSYSGTSLMAGPATMIGSTAYVYADGADYGLSKINLATAVRTSVDGSSSVNHNLGALVAAGNTLYLISGSNTAVIDYIDPVSGPDYVANVRRLRAVLAA